MGYTIDQLAGKEAVLGSEVIPVHEGTTNKAPVSLLDQGIVITEGGGTNTGIIRKNKSYVLMNDASDISLNLGEVLGKKKNPENNTYEDDAEAGAGITVTILNASARAHYVVSGSEGYKLEPTQSVQLLWSGSKFVKLLPEFLNDYPKTTDIEANYYNKQSVDNLLNSALSNYQSQVTVQSVASYQLDFSKRKNYIFLYQNLASSSGVLDFGVISCNYTSVVKVTSIYAQSSMLKISVSSDGLITMPSKYPNYNILLLLPLNMKA